MPGKGVALVTGSGKRRVGAVIADSLARRGYDLAIHYRTSAQEAEETVAALKQHGVRVTAFRADLTQADEVGTMMDRVLAEFGRLDVLVNSAAAWRSKRLEDITVADVRFYFETNTLSTFLCSQHAGLAMV